MGWDGAGAYVRQHNFSADASAGIKILAQSMDEEFNDFASAMTVALTRNGQNVPTQNLSMGGLRHINVGAPTSVNNYMRSREFIENIPVFMDDTASSADRVSISAQYFTSVSANQAPGDGTRIIVRALSDKASAALFLNGHSANIEFQDGNRALNAMVSGGLYEMLFSSADAVWRIQNPDDGRTPAERAAGVTPTNFRIPSHLSSGVVNPERYGNNTVPGTTDMTSAWNSAIAVAQQLTNGGTVEASGYHKIVSTLAVSSHRITIRGHGVDSTKIIFAPTANDVLFEFHNGASAIVNCKISDLSLWSEDSTFTKTAIDIYDAEEFQIKNVRISGAVVVGSVIMWSGANSIGIRNRGRQTLSVHDVQISADRPILISVNPNSGIDCDHSNFNNLYLIANANPCVEIETGVELFNLSFTGAQEWVLGTHGLYWLDTTSVGISIKILLENIRWEQGTDSSSYLVRIEHNTGVQGTTIRNCYGGADPRNGYYFRKVSNIRFDDVHYMGTGTALNADSTCVGIVGINCFWQSGSSATLTGQKLVYGSPLNPNSGALRPNFVYDETANADETAVTEQPLMGPSTSIAQDATTTVGTNGLKGFLFVITDENAGAIYELRGSDNDTNEVSDPNGFFSDTAGTGSSYNIYATGGNYVIQNKRTGTHSIRWLLLGAHAI